MIFIDNEMARIDQLGKQAQKEVDQIRVKYESAMLVLNEHQATMRYLRKMKTVKERYMYIESLPKPEKKQKKNFKKKALKKLGTSNSNNHPGDMILRSRDIGKNKPFDLYESIKEIETEHAKLTDEQEAFIKEMSKGIEAPNQETMIVLPKGVDPNNAEEVEQALMNSANQETDDEILSALTKMAEGEEEAIQISEQMRQSMKDDNLNPDDPKDVKEYIPMAARGIHKEGVDVPSLIRKADKDFYEGE